MPVILGVAMIGVPAVAVAQARFFDPEAAAAEARDEALATTRKTLADIGFAAREHIGPDATEVWIADRAITWGLPNGEVTANAPSAADVTRITAVIQKELARYPQGYLANAKMARVLVVENLHENGRVIPSLPNIDGGWLIDANLGDGFAARIVHHELYHFIDLADDGTLTRDDAWESLNASSFAYGAGGRSLRTSWASEHTDTAPGFVTAYATTAVAEDKAETFALWMTRPDDLAQRAAEDPIVLRKVMELRRRVAR
jgi:hypothetical protein